MTKKDNSLLYLRAENARMGLKELSGHLKMSPQRLKYSISAMEKEGGIRGPFCIFDYSYFGLILFRVYFKGGFVNERDKARLVRQLSSDPFVVSVYELTGEFELAVEFAAPNPSRFNKELKRLITELPELNDYKTVLNLVTHVYPRNYLIKNDAMRELAAEKIVGGDREKETFTSNEMAVIKALLEKPVGRYTELAHMTGLNARTVKSITKSLAKRRVVKGFKFLVGTNTLGINKWRLFLKLHNLNLESEAGLMKYMLRTSEIVQINKTVGDWDMEVDIESMDKNSIRRLMMELREEFKELIERFNLIEFYDYYKRAYLPTFLFGPPEKK